MVIALAAVAGFDLVVIGVLVAVVLVHRRWMVDRPGVFRGAVRQVSGARIGGIGRRWRHGYGRWMRDVLVWSRGPLHLRTVLVMADSAYARDAEPGEVRRLGSVPVVISYWSDGSVVEIAVHYEDRRLSAGPFVGTDKTLPPYEVKP